MRATVTSAPARTVEARLRYLGPTKEVKRLASGELRRQLGFKLRAANTCNVVYVMWHIEPDSRLAVSVKSNPGMTTHVQCDAHGYLNLKPAHQSPVPILRPGEWHRLRARLAGEELDVSLDGHAVWQGSLGAEGMAFDGPVGLRSDNGRFELELFQVQLRISSWGRSISAVPFRLCCTRLAKSCEANDAREQVWHNLRLKFGQQ